MLFDLAYSSFMEALSELVNIPGLGDARKLIGKGIMAMSQGWHEVTYASCAVSSLDVI